MPPKGNQKSKAEEPSTPKSKPKAAGSPSSTPRKAKAPVVFTKVEREPGAPIPIEVNFEGQSVQAKGSKNGTYTHTVKLEAESQFALVKTIIFTEGEYEGMQAVLIRPAKSFPFMKLPKEVRNRIYNNYFAPKGVVNSEIVIEGKRANKEVYAKTYADGSKNRVALLAACKEIYEEAVPILYDNNIKLESTSTLVDFLGQIPSTVRPRLTKVTIKNFVKTTSRNAMNFLTESPNITSLHIENAIFTEGDPVKAAKAFDADSHKFLEAVGARKGDKTGGVDVLSFGKKAFTLKDDKKNIKDWPDAMLEEFKTYLKDKLK